MLEISLSFTPSIVHVHLLLFTCSSAQTVSTIGTLLGLINSSTFPSSNIDHDLNIPKNIDSSE